jgi:hypothetical protein
MPTFEIPDGPTSVELKRSGNAQNPGPAIGSVAFSVTNKSGDGCDGRLSVVPSAGSKLEWFTIDGDRERTFDAGETQTATIKVSAPAATAAGDYPFRLRAVAVNDPDNDHAEGPVATAKVPPTAGPTPVGPKWWLWILIGVVVLLLIIGALWFAFRSKPETAVPQPAQPACASTLSGTWQGNDGGVYRLTESGNTVAWNGQSPDNGRSWAHDFHGTRSGNMIQGNWADYAGPMGRGTLTIRIDSDAHLTRVANTGSGFGGTIWTRQAPCP